MHVSNTKDFNMGLDHIIKVGGGRLYINEDEMIVLFNSSSKFIYSTMQCDAGFEATVSLDQFEAKFLKNSKSYEVTMSNNQVVFKSKNLLFIKPNIARVSILDMVQSRINAHLLSDKKGEVLIDKEFNKMSTVFKITDGFVIKDGAAFSRDNNVIYFRALPKFNIDTSIIKSSFDSLKLLSATSPLLAYTKIKDYYVFNSGSFYLGLRTVHAESDGVRILRYMSEFEPKLTIENYDMSQINELLKVGNIKDFKITFNTSDRVVLITKSQASKYVLPFEFEAKDICDSFIVSATDLKTSLKLMSNLTSVDFRSYDNFLELTQGDTKILIRKGVE